MRKFIIKSMTFLFLINIPIFLYVEYFTAYFFNADHPLYTYMNDVTLNKPSKTYGLDKPFKNQELDVLVMGDSTVVYGIKPALISDKARNISLAGAGIMEMYYLLKQYYENHTPPKNIFLSISHSTLEWTDGFVPRTMKLHLFPFSNFIEVINTSIALDNASYDYSLNKKNFIWTTRLINPVDVPSSWLQQYAQLFLYRTNSIYYYFASITNGSFFGRHEVNKRYYHRLEKHLGFRSHGRRISHPRLNKSASTSRHHFHPAPLHMHYLEKFLELAQKNGTKVIFEALPVNKKSLTRLKRKKFFLSEYSKMIKDLQEKFPAHIISDDVPVAENKFFVDSTHFNDAGATHYSRYLKKKYFNTSHLTVAKRRYAGNITKTKRAGTRWDKAGNTILSEKGLNIVFSKERHSSSMELTVDNNDSYTIKFYKKEDSVGEISLIASNKGNGLYLYKLKIPPSITDKGFDNITFTPDSGDDFFSIGHIKLLEKR